MNEPRPIPDDLTIPAIEALNRDCFCMSLDHAALAQALNSELGSPALADMVRERCPYVFSECPVFLAARHLQRMKQVVHAVESVVALPAYREQVLGGAPAVAKVGGDIRGAFFGYDFHLNQGRLGLIEINTNAGGAMLNALLARAQRSCCEAMDTMVPTGADATAFENQIVQMFRQEWRLAGNTRPLASIAIVDDDPEQQYLFPEFLLFRQLFEHAGIETVIADPGELEFRNGQLRVGDLPVDLVYNRLTDFYLAAPKHQALLDAWSSRSVVLTPHPQAYALYADKRRLALFSDDEALRSLGVPAPMRQILIENVPRTEVVDPAHAAQLWEERRKLFFKPATGYGSRASYRGDKLTRRVWDEILAGDYVAQALAPPGERQIEGEDNPRVMKFDLRAYAYDGWVQWVAARLYQGQTTNFRTRGGGFAPVFSRQAPPRCAGTGS